jgi:hypothetical protein
MKTTNEKTAAVGLGMKLRAAQRALQEARKAAGVYLASVDLDTTQWTAWKALADRLPVLMTQMGQTDETISEHRRHFEGLYQPAYDCDQCKDTGRVLVRDGEDEASEEPCSADCEAVRRYMDSVPSATTDAF